jgi:hypothetical protein
MKYSRYIINSCVIICSPNTVFKTKLDICVRGSLIEKLKQLKCVQGMKPLLLAGREMNAYIREILNNLVS